MAKRTERKLVLCKNQIKILYKAMKALKNTLTLTCAHCRQKQRISRLNLRRAVGAITSFYENTGTS